MKISLGGFGQSVAQAVQQPDASPVAAAQDRFGQIVSRVGDQQYEQGQQLARAKDETAYLDHTLAVSQLEQSTKQAIATGELPYEQAAEVHAKELAKIPPPPVTARDPAWQQRVAGQVKRTQQESQFQVGGMVQVAREKDLQSQGVAQLDALGKLAGQPGADIEAINGQASGVAKLLRTAGLTEAQASKTVQDFKDRNWYNQANNRAMQSRESLQDLKQIEHDLTADDGFYTGKLDTEKRNQVLNSVIGSRIALENKAQHLADKRETLAQRTLNQIDAQVSSGVPATPQMWADWGDTVKGTSVEGEFRDAVQDEVHVQSVLRLPIDQQLKFVQDKTSALDTQGGTLRDRANLNRLDTAVRQNVKTLQTQPLVFNANRTGQDIAPLDLDSLMSGDEATSTQLQNRVADINAMRKRYGAQVPMAPLLPQEAQELTQALEKASPADQSQLFASLYSATDDVSAYQGVMQQIAPDSPVKALAGMLYAKQAQLTTETRWFRPNDTVKSGDVAATILQGEAMLNPTKAAKAADGAPKLSMFLPETKLLQSSFQDQVGSAFAGRPAAAENAFQAVKAYYVGRAAQTGRLAASAADVDTGLVKEAITASLGTVSDYNGEGQVLAPWGMDKSDFNDRVHQAFIAETTARGMPVNTAAGLSQNIGLRNAGDSTYYVTQGRNFLYDSAHRPIIINVK